MDPLSHSNPVHTYLKRRADFYDYVVETNRRRREQEAIRYNMIVTQAHHQLGDLVMLCQKKTGKLEARWRGPFRILSYGGSHGRSFVLCPSVDRWQADQRHISWRFRKLYVPRTGYLADPNPYTFATLPDYQTSPPSLAYRF